MNSRFYTYKNVLLAAVLCTALISSCKKNEPLAPTEPVDTTSVPGTGTRAELTKDSIFLYAKQIYLWNDALPTYGVFKPRQYNSASNDLDNYEAELFAITQIPKNPATGKSYEFNPDNPEFPKYSAITDITTNNSAQAFVAKERADVELDGTGYDIGILGLNKIGPNNNYYIYVRAVFQNSPADKAGLTRGTIITKVNGRSIGTNFNAEVNSINSLFDETRTSSTVSGIKTDGSTFTDIVLNKVKYTSSPVYKTNTLTVGTKKIGYLALARFSTLQNNAKAPLDAAFNAFVAEGVTDLVIDLRYNGGGFVSTAEYLINLIAPASATGTMFIEYYNQLMRPFNSSTQKNNATILANQPLLDENDKPQYNANGTLITYNNINFSPASNTTLMSKKGNLNNVTNVVFLVSGNTASASELVINSLKPYMTVKLVGEKTYGKPVGFFPIRLENRYDVYMSLFETKNSRDEGGYFDGITPDLVDNNTINFYDDPTHDFGDPNESYLKNAIGLIAPSAAGKSSSAIMSIRGKKVSVAATLNSNAGFKTAKQFVGMIENRYQSKRNQ